MKTFLWGLGIGFAGGGAAIYFYYYKIIEAGKNALSVIEYGIGKVRAEAKKVF